MGERVPSRVQDAVARFLDDYRLAGRERTSRNYGFRLRVLTRAHGDDQVASLEPSDIRQIITSQSHLADATILNLYAALASFFRWCHEQGLIASSPLTGIPKPKQTRPEHHYLSAIQLKACYDGCRTDTERIILLLCGGAGLRSGEFLSLRWRDIDLGRQEIRVLGKGKKPRTVPLDAFTAAILDGMKGDGYLVPFRSRDALIWHVKQIAKRAGISHVTTHQLRHSFAVSWLMETGDAASLQQLLGHATGQMTSYYVRTVQHAVAVDKARTVGMAGRLFGNAAESRQERDLGE